MRLLVVRAGLLLGLGWPPLYGPPARSQDRPSTSGLRPTDGPTVLEPIPDPAADRQRGPVAAPATEGTGDGAAAGEAPDDQSGGEEGVPASIMARVLELPEGGRLTGSRWTLAQAFAALASRDPAARQAMARAYWRLAQAVADYRCCWDELAWIDQLAGRAGESAWWASARSAAAAALEEAEVVVIESQQALAERIALPGDHPPPLPADVPHVGDYRTYFREIFSGPVRPTRLEIIDRLLPLRRQQIQARARAVAAARRAVEAAAEAFDRGQLALDPVLGAMAHWGRQRRAFVAAATAYNFQIADYALALAAPDASPHALARMLVKSPADSPARPPAVEPATAAEPDVERASLTEAPAGTNPLRPASPGQPTLAPPRPDGPARSPSQPEDPAESEPSPPPPDAPAAGLRPAEAPPQIPAEAPQDGETSPPGPAPPADQAPPLVPVTRNRDTDRRVSQAAAQRDPAVAANPHRLTHAAYKPAGPSPGEPVGLYPALLDLAPSARAQRLAEALAGPPATGGGAPVDLADCLDQCPPSQREAVIRAYLRACRLGSRYRVAVTQADMIHELGLLETQVASPQDGPWPPARLAAAQQGAEAERIAALTEWQASLAELTAQTGRPLDGPWVVPSSVPHAGHYLLSRVAAAGHGRSSPPAAEKIAQWSQAVWARATAVVYADRARAQAVALDQIEPARIERALEAIRRQAEQSAAFVESLAQYNLAVAHYVLQSLPPTATGREVAEELRITR